MDGQPEALIDLGAIKENVSALRQHVGAAQVMAVVKADGYGHGMIPAARAAVAGGAERRELGRCRRMPGDVRAGQVRPDRGDLDMAAQAAVAPPLDMPVSAFRCSRAGRPARCAAAAI
jgi:hypothetical protein